MPVPKLRLVRIDNLLELAIGKLRLYFPVPQLLESELIAFQFDDEQLIAVKPDPEDVDFEAHEFVPGRRFAEELEAVEFEQEWHQQTDEYLYPRRVGRLRADYNFTEQIPLPILADWLEENGATEAATILRDHERRTTQ